MCNEYIPMLAAIMLEKIIFIKNVGTFIDYSPSNKSGWDGSFSKVNVIYAPNGSGKTTLSTIIRSASSNNSELIRLKQTVNQKEPYIKLLTTSGVVAYKDKVWNNELSNIDVFDIHFIEDYLYLSSISSEKNTDNLLKLLLGEKGINLRNRFKKLQKKRITLSEELQKYNSVKNPNINKVKSTSQKR